MSADSSTAMVEQSTTMLRHVAAGEHAVLAEIDFLEILAGRDDGEQHIDAGEIGQLVDDLAALGRQRLGLGARAVPDRDVVAGLQQPFGHRTSPCGPCRSSRFSASSLPSPFHSLAENAAPITAVLRPQPCVRSFRPCRYAAAAIHATSSRISASRSGISIMTSWPHGTS